MHGVRSVSHQKLVHELWKGIYDLDALQLQRLLLIVSKFHSTTLPIWKSCDSAENDIVNAVKKTIPSPIEFQVLNLGADMEAGTLIRWKKKTGRYDTPWRYHLPVETQKG
jgi:hypothetical protein